MWTPTSDMRRENPTLPAYVPGGHPRNPPGVRAMYLGTSTYRIHGTDAPWTIGQEVSQGCVRMYNDDVIDLYNRVTIVLASSCFVSRGKVELKIPDFCELCREAGSKIYCLFTLDRADSIGLI
jgi:hypothetical protein